MPYWKIHTIKRPRSSAANKPFVQPIHTVKRPTIFKALWQANNIIHSVHSTLPIHPYTWHTSWRGGCGFDEATKQDCEKLCYESVNQEAYEVFQQCRPSKKKHLDQCNFAEGVCGPETSEITMLSELALFNSRGAPYSSNQALLLLLYRLTLFEALGILLQQYHRGSWFSLNFPPQKSSQFGSLWISIEGRSYSY